MNYYLNKKVLRLIVIISVLMILNTYVNGQERITIENTYDKTGQLVLESMPDYFWTQFTYDKAGNRLRKLTVSQIDGIEDHNNRYLKNISVFPVPASTEISVSFSLDQASYVSFSLFSIDGKKYYSETKYMNNGSGIHNIDVSNLSVGSYVLEFICNKEKHSRIIIVN